MGSQQGTSAIERRVLSAVGGLALAIAGLHHMYNADGFGHLAQGRWIAEHGRVPKLDPFSFWKPEPQEWNNYEWAFDLLAWWAYDFGGVGALIIAKCVCLFALGWVLVLLTSRLSDNSRRALWTCLILLVLVIPASRFRFSVRPQILGLLFPALLLLGLHRIHHHQPGRRSTWIVVVALGLMHIAWLNTHGSHLLGFLTGGLYALAGFRTPAFRPLVAVVIAQVIASGCSPFGIAIIEDAVEHVANPAYRSIVGEWEPWSPKYPIYWLLSSVLQSILLVFAVRPLLKSGRSGLAGAVFCLALTLMTFRSVRFTAHHLLLTSPFIAAGLAALFKSEFSKRSQAISVLVFAALSGWAVLLSPKLQPGNIPFGLGVDERPLPWASYRYIDRNVPEPKIFADLPQSWGALFAIDDATVLIDGRVPFFGPDFTRAATAALFEPPSFGKLILPSPVDTVIIDHISDRKRGLVRAMIVAQPFKVLYIEDSRTVFIRNRPDVRHLSVLPAGYEPTLLLDRFINVKKGFEDLKRLGNEPSGAAYRSWAEALLLLHPYAEAGAHKPITMPATEADREAFRQAYELLEKASNRFPGMAAIELYRARAAIGLCRLDEAKGALARIFSPEANERVEQVEREIAARTCAPGAAK